MAKKRTSAGTSRQSPSRSLSPPRRGATAATAAGALTTARAAQSPWAVTLHVAHVNVFSDYIAKHDDAGENVTFVSAMQNEEHPRYVSFLTEMRSEVKCEITMIDAVAGLAGGSGGSGGGGVRGASASVAKCAAPSYEEDALVCLWCGSPATAPGRRAVGCPVDWMPAQIVRTRFSEISREDFTMKENVASHALAGAPDHEARPAHYKTRWAFDTMNCMLAFAIEHTDKAEYALSVMLAHKLFGELFPDALHGLKPALHWSLLSRFGGLMAKREFDARVGSVVYVHHGESELPIFKPYGRLVSTRLCFSPESSAVPGVRKTK